MHDPTDRPTFWTAMEKLSTVLSIDLTTERCAAYFDALCDLRLEDVLYACQHAARYWRSTAQEWRFPVPLTLREYAALARDQRLQQQQAQARAEAQQAERTMVAQWSETPDEVGLAAIRGILRTLGDGMEMVHPAYQEPSQEDPEQRKELLRQQVRSMIEDTFDLDGLPDEVEK